LVAPSLDLDAYSDALVVLSTAGIVVPILRRWGLNPILSCLGAGALLGPLGLGSFIKSFPFGLVDGPLATLTLAVTSLTMVLTPLRAASRRCCRRSAPPIPS
jgi:hypothetical protein